MTKKLRLCKKCGRPLKSMDIGLCEGCDKVFIELTKDLDHVKALEVYRRFIGEKNDVG